MSGQFAEIGSMVEAIGSAWSPHHHDPLRRSLAGALQAAIEAGHLPAGGRLPPERLLARRLGVGRNTVAAAYAALASAGVVTRRTGSGTYVATGRRWSAGDASRLSDNPLLRHPEPASERLIDFRTASLEADESVVPALREAATQVAVLAHGHGYVTQGWEPLRAAIAEYLSDGGLASDPDQILVTSGAQQAIDIAVSSLVDPGDPVLVESPTYPGALDVVRRVGAAVIPVPVGVNGVRSDQVRALAARVRPRLLYLTPTFNNPTGAVVPEPERQRLADLARELDFAVIEDLTLTELSSGPAPPPPIGALARADNVLSVGSFSKLFWGGLRLGWIRGPRSQIARLARVKAVGDLGSSLPAQVAGRLLLGRVDEVRARRREQLRSRYEVLEQLLRTLLPAWRWAAPAGGPSIWVRLPGGNADGFARLARVYGVDVVPGTHFSSDGSTADYLRLPFCRPPQVLEAGIGRLANAWREFEAGRPEAEDGSRPLV
jgi:DNA-binding transcriptional MocR family regulator